jgi:hypothetical protein
MLSKSSLRAAQRLYSARSLQALLEDGAGALDPGVPTSE